MQNNHLDEPQESGDNHRNVPQHEEPFPPSAAPDEADNIGNRQPPPGEEDYRRPYRGGYHDNYRRNDGSRPYNPQQRQGQRENYGSRPYNPQQRQGQRENYGSRPQYGRQGGGYNRPDGQRGYPPRDYTPGGKQEQYPRRAGNYQPRQEGGYRPQQNRRFGDNTQRDAGQNRFGGNQQRSRTPNAQNNRKTGASPRPVTLIKTLRRLDFASPKIALRAVQSGAVAINGDTVINPNAPVNRQKDSVSAHGTELRARHENLYVVLHKMRGAAGSHEAFGRSIYQNFYHPHNWFFPVGCLDKGSSGIIILTTDPQHKVPLTTPIAELEKEYHCKIHRTVPPEEIPELQRFLDEVLGEEVEMFALRRNTRTTRLSLTVTAASPTKIRAALKRYGLEILSFNRYRVGTFTAEELPAGAWRQLTPEEVVALKEFAVFSAQRNRTAAGVQGTATAEQQEKDRKSLTDKMQSLYRQFFKS